MVTIMSTMERAISHAAGVAERDAQVHEQRRAEGDEREDFGERGRWDW